MKIALYHDLPPGGALRYLVETTARSALDHDYTLFIDREAQTDRVELVESVADVRHVAHRRVSDRGRIAQLRDLSTTQRRVAASIDAEKFDLVVVHPSQTTQAPRLLQFLGPTPSVYIAQEARRRSHERGYLPWVESGGPLVRRARGVARAPLERQFGAWDRTATMAATGVVANSAFAAKSIVRAYGRQPIVCHPGVDVDAFAPGLGPRAGLVSVGALDPTKGHDLVVDALARIPKPERPALTIVFERQDPRFAAQLREMAAATGVDLTLRPNLAEKELADAYAGAIATVVAARLEPFGLTVLESLASGTPVIGVREGGFRETVTPGRTGELVDRDPVALANAIRHLPDSNLTADPHGLRDSLLPYWTWDRTVQDLHRIFDRIAGGR